MKYQFIIILTCLATLSCSERLNNASNSAIELKPQSVQAPETAGSRLPRLRTLSNGDVLMSWVEPKDKSHALKFGVLHQGSWVKRGEVAQGANWFINWADYPSVVAINDKFWMAHWLVKKQGGKAYDYDIALAISNDAGLTWREIGPPHRDGTAAEHGFAVIFPIDGDAGIIWLDGRDYVKKADLVKYPEKSGNFNLRYTRIHRDGNMEPEQVIDNNTCTCCWPSVAISSAGPVAAWRGRTDAEIRDNNISLLRHNKWTVPAPLGAEGWNIEGCPVNGPAVASRGLQVAAAWFSAEGDRPRIRAAFSNDGGKSFNQPILIDEAAPIGRIGLVWRDNNTAVISWMTAPSITSRKSSLALRTLGVDGSLGTIKIITDVNAGRDTGLPQMVSNDAGIMLAWTDMAPQYGVRTAFVSWDNIQSTASLESMNIAQTVPRYIQSICEQPH
jgi:hypothetical protein